MKMASFLKQEREEEELYSLSRLSVCSNFDGDEADEEPSDSDEKKVKSMSELNFSDSDNGCCQSLQATPPRRRRRRGVSSPISGDKAYASENEARKEKHGNDNDNKERRRRRRLRPEYPPWVNSMRRSYVDEHGGGYGGGVVVVTRPIGGGRPLCMDLGEVKACKDLGFELEPGRVSYSAGSTVDTSSGGNSPISPNHRISSPGDNPKDVKARLKAWAQAVAFVSTTHHQPPNSL
ncbi:hypothetical protein AALP_AA6G021900 [Arabis alpina]|uniref:Uncharacterized protein n=1 Tax=Arabis alpina TaxID=50452 RepID=A0A087GLJ7_ARAAL|nr:hypothetical protein AALP_AA6G021900 [Arabis alpina]